METEQFKAKKLTTIADLRSQLHTFFEGYFKGLRELSDGLVDHRAHAASISDFTTARLEKRVNDLLGEFESYQSQKKEELRVILSKFKSVMEPQKLALAQAEITTFTESAKLSVAKLKAAAHNLMVETKSMDYVPTKAVALSELSTLTWEKLGQMWLDEMIAK